MITNKKGKKMKKLLLAAIMVSSLSAQDFIQKDKVQHMAAGLITYGGCIVIGEILKKQDVTDSVNSKTCVLASIGVGAAKEFYDYKHQETHTADWNDFMATAFPSLIINYTLEF